MNVLITEWLKERASLQMRCDYEPGFGEAPSQHAFSREFHIGRLRSTPGRRAA